MSRGTWPAALLLGCLAVGAQAAGLYKWKDKDGTIHFGDKPPDTSQTDARVNTTGVPLALQDRLRGLDRSFIVTSITGNIQEATVCVQTPDDNDNRYSDPGWGDAFEASKLGKVRSATKAYGSDHDETRYDYNTGRYTSTHITVTCPEPPKDSEMSAWSYVIKFDPVAVAPYHASDKAQ